MGRAFVAAAQEGFAGQVDTALAVDFDAFDHDSIADVDDVFDFFNPFFSQLGNMDQAFFARQDFDESAEVHDARDFADVGLADFDVFGQFFDPFFGLLAAFAVNGSDVYQARIVDVDLGACFFGRSASIILPPGPMTSRSYLA